MLTLQIKEKEIENLTPEEEFIRGTVGAECQIDLDEFWQGYENTVVFKRENDCTVYNVAIDSLSNRIEIPYTILAESGSFKVGLFGVKPDEVLPTLWSDYIKVRYGTDTHGTTPPKYEPNEIDQLRLSKQDKLTAGDNITIDENNVISATGGGGSGGTTDYELLENKPQINGIELLGNKSLSELGINIPTKTSDLENDSGFIDDTAFENYYTKTEVDDKISAIPSGGAVDYELIFETILDEPVSTVSFDSLNLKSILILMEVTGTIGTGNVYTYVNSEKGMILYFPNMDILKTSKRYVANELRDIGPMYLGLQTSGQWSFTDTNVQMSGQYVPRNGEKITKCSIICVGTSGTFTAGSKFMIYGVRV